MEPTILVALIGAVATLGAAVIGRQWGKKRGREEKEREIDDAARKYVDYLDKLIQGGIEGGVKEAAIHARAIVGTRDDLRSSMMNISERLNSEIDVLKAELGSDSDRAEIYETIRVLGLKWPAKKAQVEIELRKVLAELGILGKSPRQAESTVGQTPATAGA